MNRALRIGSVTAAAAVGLAFGGGVVWWTNGDSMERNDPVRAVRSPCNLTPRDVLDEVLPGAVVVSAFRAGEPGEAWTASAECALAPRGTSTPALTLRLQRYGTQRESKGKPRRTVIHPGADRARDDFVTALADDTDICRLRAVSGVGEQAAACTGTYANAPAHLLLARRGDLVLSVTALPGPAERTEPLRRLAAGVLAAAR